MPLEIGIKDSLEQFLLVLLIALAVATTSQLFRPLRQIPYTLLLVIVGLVLAFAEVRLVNLSPELILLILLPPLLFQAAWQLEWSHLKRDLLPICLYATFGVLLSIAGTAWTLTWVGAASLPVALLIGASLAATDPVSVIALFRELGAGKRLTTLMEGESLFNDGTAVVAFGVLLGFATGMAELTVQTTLVRFVGVLAIGIAVGLAVGFAISLLTKRFDLPLVEQSLTVITAYGTYLLSEDLGGSGVIGVVVASLVLGNFGSRFSMRPATRQAVGEFWDFWAFFVNSILFLLIGNQVRFESLWANLLPISLTVTALVFTRAIAIYGLSALSSRLGVKISLSHQTVLWWGGLRGSIAVALALSVPVDFPGRGEVIATVFGVVLFTLLVQGFTTKTLLRASGELSKQPEVEVYLEAAARLAAMEKVLENLSDQAHKTMEPEFYQQHTALLQEQIDAFQLEIARLQDKHPHLRSLATDRLRQELIAIEAEIYADYMRAGLLKYKPEPLLPEMFTSKGFLERP